jgi:hypothetical protein
MAGRGVVLPQVALLIDEREIVQNQRRAILLADASIPLLTAFAKAYTRGRGFDGDGDPNEEIAAVITTASARLGSNTAQTATSRTDGEVTREQRTWFTGWTLAELFVLNRYRKRAM